LTRGWWHLTAVHPQMAEQDQLAASVAGGELDPISLSRDLRNGAAT
jgi:hypothetical protein